MCPRRPGNPLTGTSLDPEESAEDASSLPSARVTALSTCSHLSTLSLAIGDDGEGPDSAQGWDDFLIEYELDRRAEGWTPNLIQTRPLTAVGTFLEHSSTQYGCRTTFGARENIFKFPASLTITKSRRRELPLDSPRHVEPQEGPSQLRVDVTVLRAENTPRLKNVFGLKFFVTVASQAIEKRTPSVSAKRRTARWGESLGAFILQPSTPLVLRLHAERFARRDIHIAAHEMIPVESQIDTPFVLINGDGQVGEPVTLYLTVTVSPHTTSGTTLPINTPINQSNTINDSPSGEAEGSSVAQESVNPTRSAITTGSETLSPPTDRLPSEINAPVLPAADRRGLSPVESVLDGAGEAMATMNLSNQWEGALRRIKWVMDTVSPVAELHPYAKMAFGLLFAIPKTLLEQFQRDDNIGTLLDAMRDAFDFANQEERFKAIGRDSRQAQILTLMLQHVCNCCDFIRSYAEDSQLWKRILKNTGSEVDKKIEDFRATLLEHRKAFLDEASITTEITALQILDDVGIISADVGRISSQLDGMATQLKWVSSQVSDAELDRKIGEIPYGTGSRFTP
ncbi:hypothetical protein EDB86DRAFT_3243662, partial [Lactarius hatsudake]